MPKLELQKQGLFVNAYNKSALILHNIFGYKLLEQNKIYKVGFPEKSITKVLNTIEERKISYTYYDVDRKIISDKNFKRLNKYNSECNKAVKQQEIDVKAKLIYAKIKKLKSKELEPFLDKVLECLK